MTAQHKSVKIAVYAQTACEMKDKDLKRKAVIKEKEWATSEKVENQLEPTSPAASESKNKDKVFLLDDDLSRST